MHSYQYGETDPKVRIERARLAVIGEKAIEQVKDAPLSEKIKTMTETMTRANVAEHKVKIDCGQLATFMLFDEVWGTL